MTFLKLSLGILLAAAPPQGSAASETVDFARDVQPILQTHCLGCHGAERQRGDLRLDSRTAALKGGDSRGPAIVPGKSAASPLLKLVSGLDSKLRMPPKGDTLTAEQIGLLRTWIDQGAVWPERTDVVKGKDHWAFKPVVRLSLPPVQNATWVRNPIDRFILARLEKEGLTPAPEAERRTLIRRLTFDLHGLPPAPAEVEAFVAEKDPCAYEKLVDRLLASPRYGERWARHWLDVVRFAESHGFEMNQVRPAAWPYRDHVIRAFNSDKPYDQFVREQIAGDALGADEATGFLVGGPWDQVKSPDPVLTAQQRADELHDMVSTTGSVFLGLTVGCARCHNHKFDPISQADYHALKAVFSGVQHGERPWRTADHEVTAATKMVYAGKFVYPEETYRLQRGDPAQRRERIAPGGLSSFGAKLQLPMDASEQDRRLALARWITDPAHPLTSRVLVNRLWHYHFGEGIVSTPSDFGLNGARPAHPELLDWLAGEFVARKWSVKEMHRLIVLSAAYRQSSRADAKALKVDAGARLLWRYPPRRLEAESLRDTILAVSGKLDLTMGGPGFDLFEPNTNYVKVYKPKAKFGPETFRRMVYQSRPRMQLDDTFGAFDCPDAGQVAPRRTRSTTPLQAVNLLNSPFMLEQASFFAERVGKEAGEEVSAQVRRGFELAFGRQPDAEEATVAEGLVRKHGLTVFCRALFNANEFVFVP